MVINIDGSGLTNLTNTALIEDIHPDWQPVFFVACDTTIPAADTTALIAAIASANGAGSPQTLCLTDSTYTLNAVDNTADGTNGLPSVTGNITIVGDGATIVFASRGGFEVAQGGRLTLQHITLIGDVEP
jgi:hypothetical protein